MNKHKKTFLLVAIILGFTSIQMLAHSMWLEKTGYGYDFSYGEKGNIDLYDPSRVTEISSYSKTGEKSPLKISRHILDEKKGVARVFTKEDTFLLTGILDNKYWFHTKSTWKNSDNKEGLDEIIEEGNSYKLTKHIVKWADYMSKPIGCKVEIVPLTDPSKLKEGDFLTVKLYYNGKPIDFNETKISLNSDAYAEDENLAYLKSNEPVKIKISKAGLQLINAKYRLKLDDKKVVWYSFTLTFHTSK